MNLVIKLIQGRRRKKLAFQCLPYYKEGLKTLSLDLSNGDDNKPPKRR